jgi:hypothetical protein
MHMLDGVRPLTAVNAHGLITDFVVGTTSTDLRDTGKSHPVHGQGRVYVVSSTTSSACK